LSVPAGILTIILSRAFLRTGGTNAFVFWTFFVITLVPSIALIGCYEGIYNHILKNILFYGGADAALLRALFPSPMYEMPNDAWFEITGVLQGIIAIPLANHFTRMTALFFNP
jgi:hypothetical protein